jgi:RNA polymerase sigma factor (sigma-70 family)
MTVLVLAACPPDDEAEPRPGSAQAARGEERELLALARAGDLRAFEALYRSHVKRLYALCWRLCADGGSTDELVQEVFVRAWSHLGNFRGEASFATWLARVAVHLFLDERRARRRAPECLDAAHPALANRASAPAMTEDRYDLERALRALPPRARAVFVLHDIEGHRHEEIAAMMAVDVGTSKSQLHRARRLLREALR